MRRALANDLMPRLPSLSQSLIVQDVVGSLFRLDWLDEKLIWASQTNPRAPPKSASRSEQQSTFKHPHSQQSSLISFADFSQPHNEPLLTARLLSTLSGQLAYIDYTGETILLKMSMSEVLHQSPFKTPLFPETLLVGQQKRGVHTIDFDRGEAVGLGCNSPFTLAEDSCHSICALQDSATRQLEIASVLTTIGAINSTTHNTRWKLELTQVMPVGEPPVVEDKDSECQLFLLEESNDLGGDGLQLWRSNDDQRRRLLCEEARVAKALRESVLVNGRSVSIDLCGLVEVIATDQPPIEAWVSACAQRRIVSKFSFLFPILHVFPLKQLDTNNLSTLTLAASLASPTISVKLIPPDLQHALHQHLLSLLSSARDTLELRSDLEDSDSVEQKSLLIHSLLTAAKPPPRDPHVLERSLYLPLHNDRHPELKRGGRDTLSFSTVIPAGDGEIYVAVLSPPKRNVRSFGALSVIVSLPSLLLIGLGWYMHGTLQRPFPALAPNSTVAIRDALDALPAPRSAPDGTPHSEICLLTRDAEARAKSHSQSPRMFRWPKLKLKFGRRALDEDSKELDRSRDRPQRRGAQRIVNLVRHLGGRASRQSPSDGREIESKTQSKEGTEAVHEESGPQRETETRCKEGETNSANADHLGEETCEIPRGCRLHNLIENGRLERTFTNWQLIGQGGFGSVFRAEHKLEPRRPVYALKLVELEASLNGEFKGFREVTTNRHLLSKYVVRYFTWWCEQPHYLPMPTTSQKHKHADKRIPNAQKHGHQPIEERMTSVIDGGSIFRSRRVLDQSPVSNGIREDLLLDASKLARDMEGDFLLGEGTISGTTSGDGDTRPPVTVAEETRDNILFMETDKQDFSTERSPIFRQRKRGELDDANGVKNEDGDNHTLDGDETSPLKRIKETAVPITLVIQMEWCSGMTLRQWLDRPERGKSCLYSAGDCAQECVCGKKRVELVLFKQLMKGLRDIHTHGIVHRDLKPDNIFIDPTTAGLKIGDFGLSKILQSEKEEEDRDRDAARSLVSQKGLIIGTPGYAAPEGGAGCSEKADVYSSSLILLELLAHRPNTVHERHRLLATFRECTGFPDYFEEKRYSGWKVLLIAMASLHPEERPSAELILQILKQCSVAHSCRGFELDPIAVTEHLMVMLQSSPSTNLTLGLRNGESRREAQPSLITL